VDEIVRQARAYLPLSFDPSSLTRDNLRSVAVAGDHAYAYSQTLVLTLGCTKLLAV
jgi:hypothetical protein